MTSADRAPEVLGEFVEAAGGRNTTAFGELTLVVGRDRAPSVDHDGVVIRRVYRSVCSGGLTPDDLFARKPSRAAAEARRRAWTILREPPYEWHYHRIAEAAHRDRAAVWHSIHGRGRAPRARAARAKTETPKVVVPKVEAVRWAEPPVDVGAYLPGVTMPIEISPQPRWPISHRNIRALHGALTVILNQGHSSRLPLWSLRQTSASPSGWAVHWMHPAGFDIAGKVFVKHLYGRRTEFRFGPAFRFKTPQVRDGEELVKLTTVSPISIARTDEPGGVHRAPSSLVSALTGVWSHVFLEPFGTHLHDTPATRVAARQLREYLANVVKFDVVSDDTSLKVVDLGGKFGRIQGWSGECVLLANAQTRWLLEVGARIGVGSRVAFGFGQYRLEGVK